MTSVSSKRPSDSASHNGFAMDILQVLTKNKANKNLIFSPASIQMCLTLAFMAAEGKTGDELRTSLKLGNADKETIAINYGQFLNNELKSADNGPILKIANRFYVTKAFGIIAKFNEMATTHFGSQAEQLNFADSAAAVKQINTWVEKQTESKIQNIMTETDIDADTSFVLVNAIYFNGKWAKEFDVLPMKQIFYIYGNEKKEVETMTKEEWCKCADLTEYDAKAVTLPYANSNLSLLIILPKKIDGLKELETQLTNFDLNQLEKKMKHEAVKVFLPTFKLEFDVDLREPLRQLSILKLFTDEADLSSLLVRAPKHKVSKVLHKAFIDVDESGSAASAATAASAKFATSTAVKTNQPIDFHADHPFVFFIRNSGAVLFAGHVVNPQTIHI